MALYCKNYRDVCKAHDAGYVEYEGFEGVVKTGCMNTPNYNQGSVNYMRRMLQFHSGYTLIQKRGLHKIPHKMRSTRSGVSYQVSTR